MRTYRAYFRYDIASSSYQEPGTGSYDFEADDNSAAAELLPFVIAAIRQRLEAKFNYCAHEKHIKCGEIIITDLVRMVPWVNGVNIGYDWAPPDYPFADTYYFRILDDGTREKIPSGSNARV